MNTLSCCSIYGLLLFFIIHKTECFITREKELYYSNPRSNSLLNNQDAKFQGSYCCVIPTCISPAQCYHTISCGYLCTSGKYPPAEHTPGYQKKDSYTKYDCRFEKCQNYKFSCGHCQDPTVETFNYHLVRQDCKECYLLRTDIL